VTSHPKCDLNAKSKIAAIVTATQPAFVYCTSCQMPCLISQTTARLAPTIKCEILQVYERSFVLRINSSFFQMQHLTSCYVKSNVKFLNSKSAVKQFEIKNIKSLVYFEPPCRHLLKPLFAPARCYLLVRCSAVRWTKV